MSQKNDQQDASCIEENGWRQGSVLTEDLLNIESLKNFWKEELQIASPLGIIISQDCDVVHCSFKTEPLVEILFGEIKDKINFGLTGCKSPRQLDLEVVSTDDSPPICVHFHVNNRIRVERRILLCDHGPNESIELSDDNVEELRHLISLRYTRPAFPNAFNERISTHGEQIKELLKDESSSYLSCIYLLLDHDTELPPDKIYKVFINACMREKHHQDPVKRTKAQKLLNCLEETLDSCNGIEVAGSSLDSEAALSLHAIRPLKRWSAYDHITIRKSSADGIPSV